MKTQKHYVTWFFIGQFETQTFTGLSSNLKSTVELNCLPVYTVFSPVLIEGVGGMHILGGASVHIKAIGSTPIPHQSKTSSEGMGGTIP